MAHRPTAHRGTLTRRQVLWSNLRLVVTAARGSLGLVATAQIVGGLMGGAVLYSAGRVIAGLTGDEADWGATWPWIVAIAAATTLSGVLAAVAAQQRRLITELVQSHTSERLITAASAVPFERFDDEDFYDRMQRASAGSRGSATQIVYGTLGATRTLIDGVVLVGLLIAVAPVTLPIALAAYVPLFLAGRAGNRLMHRFAWDQTEDDRLRGLLAGIFTARTEAREVRMFDLGSSLGARHRRLWVERLALLRTVVKRHIAISAGGTLISSAVVAAALGLVAWMAARGDLALPDAGVAVLAVHRLSGAVSNLNGHTTSLHQGGLLMRDYEAFLAEAEADDEATAGRPAPTTVGRIDLRGVRFRYRGAPVEALRGVDLTLRRGEVTALVGPNGSGKSTLMMLLCGLYTPSAGRVEWDGTDIAEIAPGAYRSAVAAMFQDFTRYPLTARENVAIGDGASDATSEARLGDAITGAGAGEVIDQLADGLDTPLSRALKAGSELSGGQWQRIALARALYRPGLLVALDEPSSDLDALAEHELIAELSERSADRCTLIISHRFSAVRRADRIAVLDQGRILEVGTHDELMAADGLYRIMYQTQLG